MNLRSRTKNPPQCTTDPEGLEVGKHMTGVLLVIKGVIVSSGMLLVSGGVNAVAEPTSAYHKNHIERIEIVAVEGTS